MTNKILIIGSGIAALSAAEAARKQDAEAEITLITQESQLPYYRLRVGEVLANPQNEEKLYIHDKAWYEERNIKFIFGCKVKNIDCSKHELICSNEEKYQFDKCIIASGSKSRVIPQIKGFDRENVYSLWTMDDAKKFSADIASKNLKHCAIIGGGVLGMEAAWYLHKRGLKVSMIERQNHMMENQLNAEASSLLENHIKSLGIDIYCAADSKEILGEGSDGPVNGLLLADGQIIDCDAVLFSVGVIANTELAEGEVEIGRRIKVDNKMQSSAQDIYAAGDVCEVGEDGFWFGVWAMAMEQGKIAGSNAAGGSEEFSMHVPPYMVNSLGTRIVSQGDLGRSNPEDYRFEDTKDEAKHSYKRLVYKDDNLVGFILLGDAAKDMLKLQKELA